LYNTQIHVYCIKEEKRKNTLGKQDTVIDTYTAHTQYNHSSKIVEVVNKNRCAVSMCAHWSETNNFIHIDETPAKYNIDNNLLSTRRWQGDFRTWNTWMVVINSTIIILCTYVMIYILYTSSNYTYIIYIVSRYNALVII